ncbi:MAG: hypothetical protein H0U07_13915 [Actinobacteria bacterium]|nr:hypothetical protein [Actinomycetota bacterium]
MTSTGEATRDTSRTQTAVVLAAATVLSFVVLAALDHDGAGWIIFPILGLATAVTAWRAGGTSPQNMRAFVPLIIGVLAILVFLGWVIADA